MESTGMTVEVHGRLMAINGDGRICNFLEPEHASVHASYQLNTGDGDVFLLKIIKIINGQFIVIDVNGVNLSFSYPHIFHAIEADKPHLFESVDQAVSRINSELRVESNVESNQVEIVKGCCFDADWFWLHPSQLISSM